SPASAQAAYCPAVTSCTLRQNPRSVTRWGGRARLSAGRLEFDPMSNDPPSIHTICAGQRGSTSDGPAAGARPDSATLAVCPCGVGGACGGLGDEDSVPVDTSTVRAPRLEHKTAPHASNHAGGRTGSGGA